MNTPDLLTSPELPGTEPTTNGTPQRNALKFNDRSKLSDWMKIPENREYVEKQTDAESAIRAANALQIAITAGNITGMRNTLGILKFKPEKPADPPADVDLITLQQQLKAQGLKLDSTRLEANSTRELVNLLVEHVRHYESLLMNSLAGINITERELTESRSLKPLAPLPVAPLPVTATAA